MEMSRDRRGQSGVIDAVIFFAIMMVVISALMAFYQPNIQSNLAKKNYYHIEATKSTLQSLLLATIDEAHYNTSDGETIELLDKSIHELTVEDIYLRNHKAQDIEVDSLWGGIEKKINRTLFNVTETWYKYHLFAALLNKDNNTPVLQDDLMFSMGYDHSRWSGDKYSYTTYLGIASTGERIMITLYLWPI